MDCYKCNFPVRSGEGRWCDACWKAILQGGFYWDNSTADQILDGES